MSRKTLFEKLWSRHIVETTPGGSTLLYIDRHLVYEVTSPQAFDGLRSAGRRAWRPETVLATVDHNVPTTNRALGIDDPLARIQVDALGRNCKEFGILEFDLADRRQGIIHVVGPEQGATLPGMTVVAGDSHTSTHGAFAALAFGVGTSEVEHVLATQCLLLDRPKTMLVRIDGQLPRGVSAKDMILAIIGQIGVGGAVGYAIEFAGEGVDSLSMEGRMTLCNMAIEAGGRVGLIGVDDTTLTYLEHRPFAPRAGQWDAAVSYWRTLVSDADAVFDKFIVIDASSLQPMVTWGTTPDMVAAVGGRAPFLDEIADRGRRDSVRNAFDYMGLAPGTPIAAIKLDKIFIGSCTNARIEDLRSAAEVLRGQRASPSIRQALVVPGSGLVKAQAEQEGLDRLFKAAGFEWREPGCSMCLGMNDDRLSPGERCASTSNRNFEGRQGAGGRSHLVSPAMAAAAAIAGHFCDVRALLN